MSTPLVNISDGQFSWPLLETLFNNDELDESPNAALSASLYIARPLNSQSPNAPTPRPRILRFPGPRIRILRPQTKLPDPVNLPPVVNNPESSPPGAVPSAASPTPLISSQPQQNQLEQEGFPKSSTNNVNAVAIALPTTLAILTLLLASLYIVLKRDNPPERVAQLREQLLVIFCCLRARRKLGTRIIDVHVNDIGEAKSRQKRVGFVSSGGTFGISWLWSEKRKRDSDSTSDSGESGKSGIRGRGICVIPDDMDSLRMNAARLAEQGLEGWGPIGGDISKPPRDSKSKGGGKN
jgi:hypothetical protein